jgi:Dolichyl-phosphate-mannose-protein mannosyltransferase
MLIVESFVRNKSFQKNIVLILPLALSAFTHLWNPIGFPSFYVDEGHYMRRTTQVLEGLGSQEAATGYNENHQYDHPYFGQLFVAAALRLINYPDTQVTGLPGNVNSIETLYLVPRVLMGGLAIIDTFLIYKICERRYNRNIALIAAILFAVMPMSWLVRRIFLESIQLPLLLSSILFAVYSSRGSEEGKRTNHSHRLNSRYHNVLLILLSGIFLGFATFTKVPAFAMIPLVGFVIFTNNKRSFKTLGIWFIPVILIPAIWPVYAMSIGELDKWFDIERGVLWQTHRETRPLWESLDAGFEMDPILAITGIIGIGFALIWRKDLLPILWISPLIIFLYFIQFASYWHIIPIIPILCIASAILIVDISSRITNKDRMQQNITRYFRSRTDTSEKGIQQYGDFYLLYQDLINIFRPLGSVHNRSIMKTLKLRISSVQIQFVATTAMAIFGLTSTILIMSLNVNSTYFSAIAYLTQYLPDPNSIDKDEKADITIVGSPRYFWIPRYIFDKDYFYKGYTSTTPIETSKNIVVADRGFRNTLAGNEVMRNLFNDTSTLVRFSEKSVKYDVSEYPYNNMKFSYPDPKIEIRASYK